MFYSARTPKSIILLTAAFSSFVGSVSLSKNVAARIDEQQMDHINNITMIWLPSATESQSRVADICRLWPHDLKAKLTLFDGFDAGLYEGNMAAMMQTHRVQEILGEVSDQQASKANEVFVDDGSLGHKLGAVALHLGHVAVWRQVAHGPDKGWTIVLEDDAGIEPGTSLKDLEQINLRGTGGEEPTLVMLDPRKSPRGMSSPDQKCRSCAIGCGTVAYAINKKSAEHLLSKINLGLVVDMFLETAIQQICPLVNQLFHHNSQSRRSLVRMGGRAVLAEVEEDPKDTEVDKRVCKNLQI